jgi:hypothetical protein
MFARRDLKLVDSKKHPVPRVAAKYDSRSVQMLIFRLLSSNTTTSRGCLEENGPTIL